MLGYDIDPSGGRLIMNELEAKRVRDIFDLQRKYRSLTTVVNELERRGWRSKKWISKGGISHPGRVFTKTSLLRLLTNAIYAGKV